MSSAGRFLGYDLTQGWRELSLCAVDVETTGLDTANDRITEVGIVRFQGGRVVERWGSLINPQRPIPAEVTDHTGITDEMVADKPTFREAFWEVARRLRDRVMVAYNLEFDEGMLRSEYARCGMGWTDMPGLDPLIWARALMPRARSRGLATLVELLNIPLVRHHRAVDDAEAAGKVLYALGDRAEGKVPLELGELLEAQIAWNADRVAKRAARDAAKARKAAEAAAAAAPKEERNQGGLF